MCSLPQADSFAIAAVQPLRVLPAVRVFDIAGKANERMGQPMAQFTKQALAQELKTMLRVKPLDKITVKDLVEACGVNRQTFYYHFQDIYDLLGWIYRTEALDSIQNSKSHATWQQGLLLILEYVQDNRGLCVNTYRSLAREHLESFLNEVLYQLLGDVLDELRGTQVLATEDRSFIIRFYSYAFSGTLLEWIRAGMQVPAVSMVQKISRVMESNLQGAVHRFQTGLPSGQCP